jgi:hypothetical protein
LTILSPNLGNECPEALQALLRRHSKLCALLGFLPAEVSLIMIPFRLPLFGLRHVKGGTMKQSVFRAGRLTFSVV